VLNRLEGHYVEGYGDGSIKPEASIGLLSGAASDAERFLSDHPETHERFDRVTRLIDGFETPYCMELLATVHWVARNDDPKAAIDAGRAVEVVHDWSPRKRHAFRPAHIRSAWQRPREQVLVKYIYM